MTDSTAEFYEANAKAYAESTVCVDQSANCDRFLSLVKPGGRIVDCGCGSGRDLKYFKEHGFDCSGFDGSSELCKIASAYSGVNVEHCTFEDWKPDGLYDGIWANASLLHLKETDFLIFISKAAVAMTPNACFFFSMKTGIEDGLDEKGRYFRNFNDESLTQLLTAIPELKLIDKWITEDGMARTGLLWMNVALKKLFH